MFQNQVSLEDKYQRQIIVGDAILYQAVLTFINQDIPSMIKGGWLLRKAYKIYEKVYKDIHRMHTLYSQQGVPGSTEQDAPPEPAAAEIAEKDASGQKMKRDASSASLKSKNGSMELPFEVVNRLLGAVCLGYGSFQLLISMLPPKVLKIIEFLGFEGDREVGLSCLDICSHSRDMKSPMAT